MTLSAKISKKNNLNVPIKTQREPRSTKEGSKSTGKLNVKNQEMLTKLTGGGFVKLT